MSLTLPFDPSESIQATRLAWAIDRYAAGELTAEQIEATHEFSPGWDVEMHLRRFRIFRRPIDEVISYDLEPDRARAEARSGDDLVMVLVRLGDPPQRRIRSMGLAKKPAPGVTTRPATDADGPALRALERRCPVVKGDTAVYYDRGDDYFAQQRLTPHHFSSVAEYQGRVVGVFSDAIHRIRIAGTEYLASYRCHLRVDPDARGLGIMPALNMSQSMLLDESGLLSPRISHVYIAADNEQMLTTAGSAQTASVWPTNIERIALSCGDLAGPRYGRTALPQDASRIAQLLAASHGAEELALDFDAAWVTERLSRAPRDYSWTSVSLSERAVLGVWDAGIRIIRTNASGSTDTRIATALDWGFEPGAEAEFEALLRSTCATLATAGVDDLVFFSSAPSPGRDLLVGLSYISERFLVNTTGVMPRADATNGVYVDPVYF